MYKIVVNVLAGMFAGASFLAAYDNEERFIVYIGLLALCMCTLAVCESNEKLKR